MSRHNRRRHRGGHKSSNSPRTFDVDSDLSFPSAIEPSPNLLLPFGPQLGSSTTRSNASTRHWYNRWTAWQARERRQRAESASLAAEKRRLFGEDDGSGEDDILCIRMLEYFGGLDFIDG